MRQGVTFEEIHALLSYRLWLLSCQKWLHDCRTTENLHWHIADAEKSVCAALDRVWEAQQRAA